MLAMIDYSAHDGPGPDLEVRHDALHDDPHERDRDQHLPAEAHDLVVAVARERGAEPEEQEQHAEDLEGEPEEARRRESVSACRRADSPRTGSASRRRRTPRSAPRSGSCSRIRRGRRARTPMPEYSTWKPGDDLGLAFRHVERRAVGLRDAGDEIHDEQREQPEPVPGERCRPPACARCRRDSGCPRP